MSHPIIYVIAGATASGKSSRALELAEQIGGVIINADSQQIYRDLRILSARPTQQDEARAPHKLYGFVGAHEHFSAGIWLKHARMEIDWALGEARSPIVVGGTGLYLKALMQGIADIPDIDASVRAQSASDFEQMGKGAFAERLRHVDPHFFERLKVHDPQRLIRAYEVWLGTGKPLSFWQAQKAAPAYPRDQFQLEIVQLPRPQLYARCDARVLAMIKQGAIEEVRSLPQPIPPALSKIIGVTELSNSFSGKISLEQAIADMQQATRNYAKRQITWFRHQLSVDKPAENT